MLEPSNTTFRIVIVSLVLVLSSLGCKSREEPAAETPPEEWSWEDESSLKGMSESQMALANDIGAEREPRCRAIFATFANKIEVGMDSAAVGQALAPAAWMNETTVRGVYALLGQIPIDFGPGTVFCLSMLADEDGRSDWVIYLRLDGHDRPLSEDQALAFLKGSPVTTADVRIGEFALCFPASEGAAYGRYEIFSNKGIRVSDEVN